MEGLEHYDREDRPWGGFERFTLNQPSTVKLLAIREGEAFSLQKHKHRKEFWRIVKGKAVARIGDREFPMSAGENFFVPEGEIHRITGGEGGVLVLEISFGDFDEGDIIRLEDRYGRIKEKS